MIGVFVGFSHIFLRRILIFIGLTARCLYKSFGVKGLIIVAINKQKTLGSGYMVVTDHGLNSLLVRAPHL
jgi:hypothetical protein